MPDDWFRRLKQRLRAARARREVLARRITPGPHGLDAALIVSLTSYPRRFPTLHLTLFSLLRQSVRADHTILWIARDDMAALPEAVTRLRAEGLEIRATEDLRSYKKIVPALLACPGAFIATADDDVPYGADWLAQMVETAKAHPGRVIAHRAHRLAWQAGGALAPYESWRKNISGAVEGADIFATGVGGVLYPPGALHPDAARADLFLRLCPNADDIWLYWMARRAGAVVRHVGPPVRIVEWPDSQIENLRAQNLGPPGESGNDRAIAALTAEFGPTPP